MARLCSDELQCAAAALEETMSTLSYAARAKNIRNRPAIQVWHLQGLSSVPGMQGMAMLCLTMGARMQQQSSCLCWQPWLHVQPSG